MCVCVRLTWSRNCSEMGRGRSLGTDASEDPDLSWWYLSWPHWHGFFSLFFHSEFIIHVTYVIHQRSFVHGGEAKNRHGNGLQWKKAWVTGWNLCLLDPFSSVFDLWLNLGMMNFEKKTIWRLSFPRNQIILWMVVIHLPLFEHMCIFVCVRVRLHWMRADGRCKLQPESRHFCWSNLGSMAIPGS